MAYYLLQASYTPEAWAALVRKPQDRMEAVRPLIDKLGGTIEDAWFAFGDYDIVSLLRMPDNISVAAFSHAVFAGGAIKDVKITPLMTWEEGVKSLLKARELTYRSPTEET